jgi:O-antigen/teichoic acid export membrane protein
LPLYVKYVGLNQWGVIAFCNLITSLVLIIETGVGQNLIRELTTRTGVNPDFVLTKSMVFSIIERYYNIAGIALGLIIILLSDDLAKSWLRLGESEVELSRQAIIITGISLIFLIPSMLYRVVLIADSQFTSLNKIQIFYLILKNIGGIILAIYTGEIYYSLWWFAVIALMDYIHRKKLAYRSIKPNIISIINNEERQESRKIILNSFRMSIAVILGALVVNIDKLVVSKLASVEEYAVFTIASTIALAVLQVAQPIANVALPKIVSTWNDKIKLTKLNISLMLQFICISMLLILGYTFLGQKIIYTWLQNSNIAEGVYSLVSILFIGTILNMLSWVGYMNWIASNKTNTILIINGISLAISIALLPILYKNFGIEGCTSAWIILNAITILPSLNWIISPK